MLDFGYRPAASRYDVAFESRDFARGLVIDDEVSDLYDAVPAIRTLDSIDANLPAGVYWFVGIDDPVVMIIASGETGTSSNLELEGWDDTSNHPLAEAYRWVENLWVQAKPVEAPIFAIGSRAITVPDGSDVEVKSRTFLANSWSYTVSGPAGRQSLLESRLSAVELDEQPEDWVGGVKSTAARMGATLTRTKIRGKFADTVYSFHATRTVFRPYQFKPVLKLLQSGQARLLIADEVGLGKTIEAGLIWTELEARHESDRVLIVCPSGLVEKWRDEMNERFGFELKLLDRPELGRFLEQHQTGRRPSRQSYVVSLETLRTWDGLEELEENPPEFDLVIVDEAHYMRNSGTKSYLLGTQLSEWTAGANLVFLTATPINLRETDLLHLLGLLEPADFDTIEDLEVRLEPTAVLNQVAKVLPDKSATPAMFHQILRQLEGLVLEKSVTSKPEFADLREIVDRAPLSARDIALARRAISRLNTLSTTVTRTRRAEVDEQKPLRNAAGIEVSWNDTERSFYQEFLKWCFLRAKAAKTAMYFSMQMPIRLASTSIHMAANSVLAGAPEKWKGDSPISERRNWVEPHPELIHLANQVLRLPESKVEILGEVLANIHDLGRQALLFTWSKATLTNLRGAFHERYRIAVLNGDVPRLQRRQIMKDFRNGGYDFVFANRVASEGLDFEFCSAVINYDLPWNPMEVEQRIGRIDRIGQESEQILIRNFYNNDAIDSRIMHKVLERIEIFERSIGELEPIIGQHMDLLQTAMDFTLTPEQQEAKAEQFLSAIEAQKAAVQDVAESSAGLMIADDVEIAGLEKELTSTGRYLGQSELSHLIDDWAATDGGGSVEWIEGGKILEVRGNQTMAGRLVELIQKGRRTRSETGSLIVKLQNGEPIHLALDQEIARTTELDMLSATHPLVMAASGVPGHKQARFASIQIERTEILAPGDYVVTLAHAVNAARGGDEIWGAAIGLNGAPAGDAPVDGLMASLARGEWREAPSHPNVDLAHLVSRTKREIEKRHRIVQAKRDSEEEVLSETRRAILADQHQRRMRGIQRRLETIIERERGEKVLRMVNGQRNRQQNRYDQLIAELDASPLPAVSISYLAVCTLRVTQ
jgi:superfamily II DNA or RNA helicase